MKKKWNQKAISALFIAGIVLSLAACQDSGRSNAGTETNESGSEANETESAQNETETAVPESETGAVETETAEEETGTKESDAGMPDSAYLSIEVADYVDPTSPDNEMTTEILKKPLDGSTDEISCVSVSPQYNFGVYYESDSAIYYSAVDETGYHDQLWRYSIDTQESEQLTDSLSVISYIIPRENDIFLIAIETGEEDAYTPFIFDKATNELTKVAVDIDINCMLCAYDPVSNRLIISGGSYSEEQEVMEQWNARENQNEPYVPADFPIYVYDDFVFVSENELYCVGAGNDSTKYPRGVYRYDISEDSLELIYDEIENGGYVGTLRFIG